MQSKVPRLSSGARPLLKSKYGILLAGSVLVVKMLPQTLLKDKLVEWSTLMRDGMAVQLDSQLSELLQRAVTDINFSDSEKPLVEGYITPGTQVEHYGSVNTMFGASIGIPEYFQISTVEEAALKLNLPQDDNEHEDVMSLKQTLLLSEKAKLYAIARAAVRSRDWDFFLQGLCLSLFSLQSYTICRWLDTKYLMEKCRKQRQLFFGGVLIFGLLICQVISVCISYRFDVAAEYKVYKLGKSYMEGSIEYNETLMLRNRLLRSVLGDKGKAHFLENGDVNALMGEMNYSERLLCVELAMNDIKKIKTKKKEESIC